MTQHDKAVKLVKDFMALYLTEYWPDTELNETVGYILRVLDRREKDEEKMRISNDKIELLMARQKLTISEVAARSGVSRQSISTIRLRGTCTPKTAARLADGLGVDVTEIMEQEGNR